MQMGNVHTCCPMKCRRRVICDSRRLRRSRNNCITRRSFQSQRCDNTSNSQCIESTCSQCSFFRWRKCIAHGEGWQVVLHVGAPSKIDAHSSPIIMRSRSAHCKWVGQIERRMVHPNFDKKFLKVNLVTRKMSMIQVSHDVVEPRVSICMRCSRHTIYAKQENKRATICKGVQTQ